MKNPSICADGQVFMARNVIIMRGLFYFVRSHPELFTQFRELSISLVLGRLNCGASTRVLFHRATKTVRIEMICRKL